MTQPRPTPPASPWRSPWLGVLLGAMLLLLVQVVFERGQPGTLWADLAYLLVMYAAVAVAVAAWRGAHPQQRQALGLFALALGAFALGDTIVTRYELVAHDVPDFSLADPFYYLYYVLMAAALIRLIRIKFSSLYALAMLLDSIIMMGIVWIFAWFFVLAGGWQTGESNLLFRWVSLSYVGLDLALLGLVLLTLRRHRLDAALALLALGLVLAVGADLEFSYLSSPNADVSVLSSLLWLFGTVLQALGMWRMRGWSDADFLQRPPRPLRLILASFPYVAVLASCGLMIVTFTQRSASSTGVLIGTVSVFFLVLLRQGLVFQENLHLTRELRRSSHELQRSSLQLQHQVNHDLLTALPNRQLFIQQLDTALNAGQPLSVMFIDLDGFKLVNDTFGHSTGDELLCQVAQRFTSRLTPGALLARIGGDEFTLLLPDDQGGTAARRQAAQLVSILNTPFYFNDLPVMISASIGISLYPQHGQTSEQLQSQADIAMYHAKASGKNRASMFHVSMDTRRQRRYEMEGALRHAAERQEFTLVYQPQLSGAQVSGVEALLRWYHPHLGQVSPAEFIPLAEETGFILKIGQWVLETACQQAATWQRAGRRLRVAVNVSPLEFTQPDFVEVIAGALARHALPGGALELEITEGLLMQDVRGSAQKLQALRDLGVRISVDDFGVGHSSLG